MNTIVRGIDRVSEICGYLGAAAILALIAVTMVEVFSRYVLHAPTIWAFDAAYMLNGSAFILACAAALKVNQHVSIDIFSQFFSLRTKRIIEAVTFALLVLPALGFVTSAAWAEFWRAFMEGTIEQVSPWRPKIWPFRLVLAIGLSALWLQVLARVLKPSPPFSSH